MTLRGAVQGLAGTAVVAGTLWVLMAPGTGGIPLLLLALITLVAVRYESWRERPAPPIAGPEWRPTGERFEDPVTGKVMEVQYNARTGERRYQPDDPV
jgi:hypothetical protein